MTVCPTRPIFVNAKNQRSTGEAGTLSNQLIDITSGTTGNLILRVMRPATMTNATLVETKASAAGLQAACYAYSTTSTPSFTGRTTNNSIGITGCSVDTYTIPISSYFGPTTPNSINCGRMKTSADTYLGYLNIQADAKTTGASDKMLSLNALVNPLVFQVTIPTTLTYRTTPEIQVPPPNPIVSTYLPTVVYTKTNTTGSNGNITISIEINLTQNYTSVGNTAAWVGGLFPVVLPVTNYFPTSPYPTWNAKACTVLSPGKLKCETVASFNNFCAAVGSLQAIKTARGFYKLNYNIACAANQGSCIQGDTLPFSLDFTIGDNVDNEICGAVGIRVVSNLGAVYKTDLRSVNALTSTWNATLTPKSVSEPLKLNEPVTYSGYIDSPFDLASLTITSVKMACGANCIASKSYEFIPNAPGYSATVPAANLFKVLTNPALKQWAIGFTPMMYSVEMEGTSAREVDYFYNYRLFSFGSTVSSETWTLEVTASIQYSIGQLNSLTKRAEAQQVSKKFTLPVGMAPVAPNKSPANDQPALIRFGAPAAALAMGLALL